MPKLYVCNECGYVFPNELTKLIESKYQVFCERCGSPFNLKGVNFKPITRDVIEDLFKSSDFVPRDGSKPVQISSDKKPHSTLEKIIQKLAAFSYVPVLIVSIISLIFMLKIIFVPSLVFNVILEQTLLSITGFIVAFYDKYRINPRVEERKYQEILLDAFCFGILGCILFGSGFFILLKGILIFFVYVFDSDKRKDFYMTGVYLKDSLNRFSALGGLFIIILAIYNLITQSGLSLPIQVFSVVFFPLIIIFALAIVVLIVDAALREKLDKKYKIESGEAVRTFIMGVIGCIFFAAGIFILLKGIVMLFLAVIGPPDKTKIQAVKMKWEEDESFNRKKVEDFYYKEETVETPKSIEHKELETEKIEPLTPPEIKESQKQQQIKDEIHRIEKEEKKEGKEITKEREPEKPRKGEKETEEAIKLKLHESLLPVKNEKDKKLVTEYFTRIFNVLSKDIKEQIKDLKIPKKEKKEILKELAFLTKEQQIKYINNLIVLYQEQIPKKLIERIEKLSNLKPENYEKIIDQLKYMDSDEQIKFIKYLENNA
jgi:DNA-directed RNA polymerase subunit RPC12/RpoP